MPNAKPQIPNPKSKSQIPNPKSYPPPFHLSTLVKKGISDFFEIQRLIEMYSQRRTQNPKPNTQNALARCSKYFPKPKRCDSPSPKSEQVSWLLDGKSQSRRSQRANPTSPHCSWVLFMIPSSKSQFPKVKAYFRFWKQSPTQEKPNLQNPIFSSLGLG